MSKIVLFPDKIKCITGSKSNVIAALKYNGIDNLISKRY